MILNKFIFVNLEVLHENHTYLHDFFYKINYFYLTNASTCFCTAKSCKSSDSRAFS